MRSSFSAILAALALLVGVSPASAEVYNMQTAGDPSVTTQPSSLGLSLNILNGLVIVNVDPVPLVGTATVDMNLDASNSGQLYLTDSLLTLGNFVVNQSGNSILGPYSIQLTGNGVQVAVTGGPITVTNGSFLISAATVGTLGLNGGTLDYDLQLSALGVNEQGVLDLAADPVSVEFSSLGAITIPGTADDDLGGNDSVDANGHTLGGAGLTGLSNIDNDGSEVNLSFDGVSLTSNLDLGGIMIPIVLTLQGGVSVSVPEVGTTTMLGVAFAGAGVAGLVRRNRKSC